MSDAKQLHPITWWADRLGINRKAIQRAIGWGHLHATRLGISDNSPYYLSQADIDAWIESRRVRKRAW